jgi:mono/diheme cytochrome c family protein
MTRHFRSAWCALLAGAFWIAACDAPPPPAPAPPPAAKTVPAEPAVDPAALQAEAEELFAMRCQTCHGARGAGNGPGSAALTPKPRNFQDPEWQVSVDDDHIANIIQYGGAAVGKSPVMPGNPDLASKPELVNALVQVIRGLSAR